MVRPVSWGHLVLPILGPSGGAPFEAGFRMGTVPITESSAYNRIECLLPNRMPVTESSAYYRIERLLP